MICMQCSAWPTEEQRGRTMMSCMSGSSDGRNAESRASLLPSTSFVSAGQISCGTPACVLGFATTIFVSAEVSS